MKGAKIYLLQCCEIICARHTNCDGCCIKCQDCPISKFRVKERGYVLQKEAYKAVMEYLKKSKRDNHYLQQCFLAYMDLG